MRSLFLLIAAFALSGAAPSTGEFALTSPAFNPSGTIPRKYTCDGEDASPPLLWTGVPEQARDLVVIVEDPDAPGGALVHWILYDVPAALGGLAEGLPKQETLPDGSMQGLNAFDTVGYRGPCPPKGKPHGYVFHAFALSEPVGLSPSAAKPRLLAAMKGKILAQAELLASYGR